MCSGMNYSGRQGNAFLLEMSTDNNSQSASTSSSQTATYHQRDGSNAGVKAINNNHHRVVHQRKFSSMAVSRRTSSQRRRSADRTLLAFRNVETAKSHIKDNLKKYSTILFLLSVVAGMAAIVDMEVSIARRDTISQLQTPVNLSKASYTNNANYSLYNGLELSSKTLISILSLATCICLYCFYLNLYHLDVVRNLYPAESSFCVSGIAYRFVGELVLCSVHIPPWMDRFGIPAELQLIVFIRLYLVMRFLKEKHQLMTSKSTRFLASVTKTELSSMFLLKTYFMRNPFALIVSCYLLTVFLGGYAVYLVEGTDSYLDTTWMLVVTMTTVGFGDFSPETTIGRFMVAAAALIGIFLMALFISLVHESLQLSQQEKRILAYIDGTEYMRYRKSMAALAIQSWWRYARFRMHLTVTAYRKQATVYDRFRIRRLRNKMYRILMRWRVIRSPPEHHLNKDFQMDNTAMMLTNVARKVLHIEDGIDLLLSTKHTQGNSRKVSDVASISSGRRKNSRVAWQQPITGHFKTDEQDEMANISENASIAEDSSSMSVEEKQMKKEHELLQLANGSAGHKTSKIEGNIEVVLAHVVAQIRHTEETVELLQNNTRKELKDLEKKIIAMCRMQTREVPELDVDQCKKITSMRSSTC